MRSKQKEFYHVPVNTDEIFRLRFVEASAADDYFRELLTSPRPDHSAPAIIFEKDGSYPGELFGIVHGEDGTLIHFFYFSTDKVLLPLLRRHRINAAIRVKMPEYQAFKAENSRLNTLFSDKLTLPMFLGDARTLPQTATIQQKTKMDPVVAAVLLVLFSLLSHFLSYRRRKPTVKPDALEDAAHGFIQAIHDPKKRAKVERVARAQHLQALLRDPASAKKMLSFINEAARDDKVAQQADRLLAAVPNANTRRVLRRVLDETKTKAAAATTTSKPAMLPPPPPSNPPQKHKPTTLQEFIRKNRQQIATSAGAVSPVFRRQLSSFLSRSGVSDPAPIVRALSSHATSTALSNKKMTPRKMTDAIAHFITQGKTETRRPTFTISPARKPRRHLPQIEEEEKEKKERRSILEQHQGGEAVQLVRRTPGKKQTDLGAGVFDVNIQRILHESKTYKKVISTLRDVMESRQIQKAYVVDAPNMLAHRGYKYASRQRTTASEEFVAGMRAKLGASPTDMMVVVSQMNRGEWVRDDPVYFGRIGPDQDNTFLVRVGCFDEGEGVDCHRSSNTKKNECDDFVRLDLMARLSDGKTEFFHATNDLGRNWHYVDLHPLIKHVKDIRF